MKKYITILLILICAAIISIYSLSINKEEPIVEEEDDIIIEEPEDPVVIDDPLDDLIVLDSPKPGQKISSPLTFKGKARGTWYFEATFPIVITDWDGLIIAQGYAQATDEWMTEDFVPFEAVIEFEKPAYGERGTIILQRSNPSGLPENDNALEFNILFQ